MTRRITATDRMLAHADKLARAAGEVVGSRRRTHRRLGDIDVVLVEQAGEPTAVYLSDVGDDGVIVELTAERLFEVATLVRELLAAPPPVKRRRKS